MLICEKEENREKKRGLENKLLNMPKIGSNQIKIRIPDIANIEKPPIIPVDNKVPSETDKINPPKNNLNPEGPNCEIFKKDSLKGQKILIVMLYNAEIECSIANFLKIMSIKL